MELLANQSKSLMNNVDKTVREMSEEEEEEEDQLTRSNKKIKGLEQREETMDDKMEDSNAEEKRTESISESIPAETESKKGDQKVCSYRDKLLRANGCIYTPENETNCGMEEEKGLDMSDNEEEGKSFNALCPMITISKDEWKALCEPWKLCLVVKLLGKTLGFRFLKVRLQKLWLKEGNMDFINIGNDVFLVKFLNQRDYNFALIEGP